MLHAATLQETLTSYIAPRSDMHSAKLFAAMISSALLIFISNENVP